MNVLALSDSKDCVIEHNSYTINRTLSSVSLDSTGNLIVDNTEAIAPSDFKISVKVGS